MRLEPLRRRDVTICATANFRIDREALDDTFSFTTYEHA